MKNRILLAKLLSIIIFSVTLISNHPYYWDEFAYEFMVESLGFVLLSASAFGRIWSSAFISGKKNKSLVTDGPYSMVRNPLYFCSFLGFLGAGLAFKSIVISTLLGIVFFLTHGSTILDEEKILAELFGRSYRSYKNSVPRFIPKPSLLKLPENVSLSPSIFTKALLDSSLIVSVFIMAHLIEWAHIHSILPILLKLY